MTGQLRGIASALSKQGANLIFSYPNESIKKELNHWQRNVIQRFFSM